MILKNPDDPRYKYEDLRPTAISTKQLDDLMNYVIAPSGTGTVVDAIISGVKIVVVAGYMFARDKIQAKEAEYKKQVYERDKSGQNQGEVDDDDVGNQPRNPPRT